METDDQAARGTQPAASDAVAAYSEEHTGRSVIPDGFSLRDQPAKGREAGAEDGGGSSGDGMAWSSTAAADNSQGAAPEVNFRPRNGTLSRTNARRISVNASRSPLSSVFAEHANADVAEQTLSASSDNSSRRVSRSLSASGRSSTSASAETPRRSRPLSMVAIQAAERYKQSFTSDAHATTKAALDALPETKTGDTSSAPTEQDDPSVERTGRSRTREANGSESRGTSRSRSIGRRQHNFQALQRQFEQQAATTPLPEMPPAPDTRHPLVEPEVPSSTDTGGSDTAMSDAPDTRSGPVRASRRVRTPSQNFNRNVLDQAAIKAAARSHAVPLSERSVSDTGPGVARERASSATSPPPLLPVGMAPRRKRTFPSVKPTPGEADTAVAASPSYATSETRSGSATQLPTDQEERSASGATGRGHTSNQHPSLATIFGEETIRQMNISTTRGIASRHMAGTMSDTVLAAQQNKPLPPIPQASHHAWLGQSDSNNASTESLSSDASRTSYAAARPRSSSEQLSNTDEAQAARRALRAARLSRHGRSTSQTDASQRTPRPPPPVPPVRSSSRKRPSATAVSASAASVPPPPAPPNNTEATQNSQASAAVRRRPSQSSTPSAATTEKRRSRIQELAATLEETLRSPILQAAQLYRTQNSDASSTHQQPPEAMAEDPMAPRTNLATPTKYSTVGAHAGARAVVRHMDSAVGMNTAAPTARMSRASTLSRSRSMEFDEAKLVAEVTTLTRAPEHPAEKRRRVVSELVNTEAAFASDMEVLYDVYYVSVRASPLFGPTDARALFANLEEVRALAGDFTVHLATASRMCLAGNGKDYIYIGTKEGGEPGDGGIVGAVFLSMIGRLEEVYGEYCKRYDMGVERLQELSTQPQYQRFFATCKEKLAGRTTSWDLGSLLIKPVQREVLKHTEPEHPDHRQLLRLSSELQHMADRINEGKRRKEVVEGIVGGRKKGSMDKKINRNTRKLLMRAGRLDETVDERFNELHAQFQQQQELARMFLRQADAWVQSLQNYFDWQRQLATSLEDVYLIARDPLWAASLGKQVMDYRTRMARMAAEAWQDARRDVQHRVREPIMRMLELYKGPMAVIQKRANKLIDYDRARDIRSRNDKPDRMTQESADAYVAINAQLIDELPTFIRCTARYFDAITRDMARLQAEAYGRMLGEAQVILEKLMSLGFCRGDIDDVVSEHQRSMDGEFGFTALLMELNVVNGSWRDLVVGPTTSLTDESRSMYDSIRSGASSKANSIMDRTPIAREPASRTSEDTPMSTGTRLHLGPSRRHMKELRRSVSHGSLPRPAANGTAAVRGYGSISSIFEVTSHAQAETRPSVPPQVAALAASEIPRRFSSLANGQNASAQPYVERDVTAELSAAVAAVAVTRSPGEDMGLFSAKLPQTPRYLFICLSLYPYEPSEDAGGEMALTASSTGSTIGVISIDEEGDWWYGKNLDTGASGWFPASYCQRLN
ncbi:hypothetical protein THASP1DRAFT_31402 [Thamnocephalis sphaerospora]|uniref:Scaffold protein Tuba n=1 Tax=Thamnocephalis sphaerospora TaxID=78915 RepID=A0A4P9XLS6_9FUNG|nr:hypothetical protein THASP1DRAFT_31402 [Thamnocephalis sphaerospora]|eukprot:RKP06785.1 hypothetical protein THASP1DRAFT_31402 [Thamnocephalis sphaerospora]